MFQYPQSMTVLVQVEAVSILKHSLIYFALIVRQASKHSRTFKNKLANNSKQIESYSYHFYQYTIHIFALPYHKQAFVAAQGFRFFLDNFNAQAAYDYANAIFSVQEQFTVPATFNLTQQQVTQQFVSVASQKLGSQYHFDEKALSAAYLPGTKYDIESRRTWKFATSKSVSGTPMFFVNGVLFDGAEDYTAEQWIEFVNARNPKREESLIERIENFLGLE